MPFFDQKIKPAFNDKIKGKSLCVKENLPTFVERNRVPKFARRNAVPGYGTETRFLVFGPVVTSNLLRYNFKKEKNMKKHNLHDKFFWVGTS